MRTYPTAFRRSGGPCQSQIENHDDFPKLDHRTAPSFWAEQDWVIDSPPIPRARPGMSDTINWGIFKRHFWGTPASTDLVWSCEVAEHIEPRAVNNYIDTLVNGRIIAMTHAVPGQAGHHHVNCQPRDYRLDLIAQRGYSISEDNDVFIEISKTNHTWNYFSRTGLVFVRD